MKYKHPIIKSITVTLLATIIAYVLGLTYYLTAGILAMISIQKTKKLSFLIALKRLVLVVISLIISNILFILLGHNLYAYALFILLVVLLSFTFNLTEGTIPSVVVVTHIYVYSVFSWTFSLETLLLFLISISTALLFNFFYPSESMMNLEKYRNDLDETIKEHILYISNKLSNLEKTCKLTNELETRIEDIIERIDQTTGDLVMRNHQEISGYTLMRKKQFDILKDICSTSDKLTKVYSQTDSIAEYLIKLSKDIGAKDLANYQLLTLDSLLDSFKRDQLPESREEFENRANLYHIVLSLKQFLHIKIDYHEEFTNSEITKGVI